MALCFPIGSKRKLLKWLQENIEKLIMFNKRRGFHSFREKLSFLFQDQPLRHVEQGLELFEIGVPVELQILIVMLPKMQCGLHRC